MGIMKSLKQANQDEMELIFMNDESLYRLARLSDKDTLRQVYEGMWRHKPEEWYSSQFSWNDLEDIDWQRIIDLCKGE